MEIQFRMLHEKPRILIISSAIGWIGISRLPKALKEAGADVFVLHHERSWLRYTRWVDGQRILPETFSRLGMLRRVCKAILDWKPDLILPGDDEIIPFLYKLWNWLDKAKYLHWIGPIRTLLDSFNRSFGGLKHLEARFLRYPLVALAKELGLCVPEALSTADWQEACAFGKKEGYPIVVKKEYTAGGGGVRVCETPEEVESAFHDFQGIPVKWGIWRRLEAFLPRSLKTFDAPSSPVMEVQSFIQGETWMYATVAHEGRILSGVSLAKEQVFPPKIGPTSVARLGRHEGMELAIRTLLEELCFTGSSGIDCIICKDTNRAYVIEMNPRPTPPVHLSPLFGENLPAALVSIARGTPQVYVSEPPEHEKVIMYPGELFRDPNSDYFGKYYQDVPSDDPELEKELAAYVEERLLEKKEKSG